MKRIIIFITIWALLSVNVYADRKYAYIEELFEIRTILTEHGKELSRKMKTASAEEQRTLERIFELNSSALTVIEAYFRIFKIAVASEDSFNMNSINILNEWLEFMKTQCVFDLEYIDSAIQETRDIEVMSHLQKAKTNISNLVDVSSNAIDQNNLLLASN